MANSLAKDIILHRNVTNSEMWGPQPTDNHISVQATQINNTTIQYNIRDLENGTYVIEKSSHKKFDHSKAEDSTPDITSNSTHSFNVQFLTILHQNIGGLRNKVNEDSDQNGRP